MRRIKLLLILVFTFPIAQDFFMRKNAAWGQVGWGTSEYQVGTKRVLIFPKLPAGGGVATTIRLYTEYRIFPFPCNADLNPLFLDPPLLFRQTIGEGVNCGVLIGVLDLVNWWSFVVKKIPKDFEEILGIHETLNGNPIAVSQSPLTLWSISSDEYSGNIKPSEILGWKKERVFSTSFAGGQELEGNKQFHVRYNKVDSDIVSIKMFLEARFQTPAPEISPVPGYTTDDEFRYAISKMCNLVEGATVGYAGVGKARRGIFAIQFTWTLDCDGDGTIEMDELMNSSIVLRREKKAADGTWALDVAGPMGATYSNIPLGLAAAGCGIE